MKKKKIQTIVERSEYSNVFDDKVNAALADGWWLARRDAIPVSHESVLLYAELELDVDDEYEDCTEPTLATWLQSRDPLNPLKCSKCGYSPDLMEEDNMATCKGCGAMMANANVLD